MRLYRHLLHLSPVGSTVALALAVVSAATSTVTPLLLGRTVGSFSDGSTTTQSLMWASILIGVLLIAEARDTATSMVREFVVRKAEKDLRLRTADSFVAGPGLEAAESPERTGTAKRVTESMWQFSNGSGAAISNLPRGTLTIIGATVTLGIVFSWVFAGLLVVAVVLQTSLMTRIVSSQMGVWEHSTEHQKHASYAVEQSLGPAAKELRIFGLGSYLVDRYRDNLLIALRPWWRRRWAYAVQQAAAASLLVGSMVGALAWAAHLTDAGRLSVAGLTTTAALIVAFGEMDLWGFSTFASASRRLEWLEELSPPERGALVRRIQAREVGAAPVRPGPAPEIVLDDVSFHYPGQELAVLDGLTWRLPAGEATALVGVNGAGKSTLVKLLTGGYRPTRGRILADGVDLATLDDEQLAAWQRRLAPITQDFLRLPLSAGDNVEMGSGRVWSGRLDLVDHPHRELDDLARRAGLTDLVQRLPTRWATPLDKTFVGGTDLSGGEWQRIGLARALRAVDEGAGLLILDEPAAALDVESEARLVHSYLDLASKATSLLISHRFSVVRPVPNICVLDHGRITEQGTHDELMATGGQYARLFALQAARYALDPNASDEDEALNEQVHP